MAVVKYGERLDSESGRLKIFDDFINDYVYRLTDQSNAERGTPVSSIKYVFHAEKGWGYREFIPSTTFEYKGKNLVLNNDSDPVSGTVTGIVMRDVNGKLIYEISDIEIPFTLADIGLLGPDFMEAVFKKGATLYGTNGRQLMEGGDYKDSIYGRGGDDTMYGNGHHDMMKGGDGNDTIFGDAKSSLHDMFIFNGNDQLYGEAGNDKLIGSGGHDLLDGGTGADTMTGGTGNDTYVVDNAKDKVIENAKEGTDLVKASVSYALAANVENLTLTGSKSIGGTGNSLNNVIVGNSGNNTLKGGSGNDTLKGGSGNDKLEGDAGKDILYGGSGADQFIYVKLSDSTVSASGRDIIEDFSRAQGDRTNLQAIDANSKVAGNQAFHLIGTDTFNKKAGELRYEKKNGDTYVYGDVNGDGKADFAIQYDASISFRAADFIL